MMYKLQAGGSRNLPSHPSMGQSGTRGLASAISSGSTNRQGLAITRIFYCSANITTVRRVSKGRYLRPGSCRLVRCIPSHPKEQKYGQWSPRVRPCAGRCHSYLFVDPSRPKPSRDHGSRPEARRLIFGRKIKFYFLSRFRVR